MLTMGQTLSQVLRTLVSCNSHQFCKAGTSVPRWRNWGSERSSDLPKVIQLDLNSWYLWLKKHMLVVNLLPQVNNAKLAGRKCLQGNNQRGTPALGDHGDPWVLGTPWLSSRWRRGALSRPLRQCKGAAPWLGKQLLKGSPMLLCPDLCHSLAFKLVCAGALATYQGTHYSESSRERISRCWSFGMKFWNRDNLLTLLEDALVPVAFPPCHRREACLSPLLNPTEYITPGMLKPSEHQREHEQQLVSEQPSLLTGQGSLDL